MNRRSYYWLLLAITLAVFFAATPTRTLLTHILGFDCHPYTFALAHFLSEMFVRLLKLISLPLISLSLLSTISHVGENSLSGIGKKVVSYTVFTTLIAASCALFFYLIIAPVSVAPIAHTAKAASLSYTDHLLKLIPSNLLEPFLEGNVVSILLLSLLLGAGIAQLPKEQRLPIHQLLQSLFQIMMQITRWIVTLMPIAIWAFTMTFITELFAGLTIPHQVGWYLVTILSANLVQGIIILPLFLWINGISPWKTFHKMLPALSFAFFSKSSCAAMPGAIDCAERDLGVSPPVARFSFPLCTSINMNACAGFIIITVLFIAQSNGVHFTAIEQLTWILIATVAAIGNAGVPMGCFFIASALLSTMDVPLTLMGIILPFYALLDMLESAINLWSDACVTVIVDRKNKLALTSDLNPA